MPPDAPHLLNRFEEPPPTMRAIAGGLVVLVLIAAAIGHREALAGLLLFVAGNLVSILPVVLLAAGLAAALVASGADGALALKMRGRQGGLILAAAAAGAVTPVCGISALPVIAGLLRSGVPIAPVMAFWLSSPVTDPAMFAITAATLGTDFAVAKTMIAFGIGLAGGWLTAALAGAGWLRAPLRRNASALSDCEPLPWRGAFWREPARTRLFAREAIGSGLFIGKWLAVAFAAEYVLRHQIAPETVANLVGADSNFAIPLAVGVGAPIYLDGYAALPLVRGLLDLGMSPGAAMGFLVSGGIVSLYASIAVFALVRLPVFALYLGLAISLSLVGAYAYEVVAL